MFYKKKAKKWLCKNRHMKGDSLCHSDLSLEGRWDITSQLWEITVGGGKRHFCDVRIEQLLWLSLWEAPCIYTVCLSLVLFAEMLWMQLRGEAHLTKDGGKQTTTWLISEVASQLQHSDKTAPQLTAWPKISRETSARH